MIDERTHTTGLGRQVLKTKQVATNLRMSFWGAKKTNFDNKCVELILSDLTNIYTFYCISSDAPSYSNKKYTS